MTRIPLLLALSGSLTLLCAQPRIGLVETYGNRKIAKDKVEKAVGVKPDGPLPPSKGDMEETILAIDGVVRSNVEVFCCEEGKTILYIGIEERGQPALPFHLEPSTEIALPDEIVSTYQEFTAALNVASRAGDLKEDFSRGYSLMENLPARMVQERFVGLAELNQGQLQNVVRNSAYPEQRAIAAYVVGYAPTRAGVVDDLQYALQDPEPSVRANAARALKAIAILATNKGEDLRVQLTWFVEMLNSCVLSDRLEGSRALVTLSDRLTPYTIAQIKERALPSLFEMARWKHLPHALPAYLLLGKVAGLSDQEVQSAWVKGDRDSVLAKIQKQFKK
jgi:hypothetical protein